MTSARCNLLIIAFLMSMLSACSTYIASKQDDLLTQIDVWSTENEFGKAFETLEYVKKTHPQYAELQTRKKSLSSEAREYELKIRNHVLKLIKKKHWADALDLIDQAIEKYPQGKEINKIEQQLLNKQAIAIAVIDQKIMLERAQWMIKTRPIYQTKLTTDPRNEELKTYLNNLDIEAQELSQQLTLLSTQAIQKKHYKTARLRITQAIALAPTKERQKVLSSLKNRAQKSHSEKKKAQKRIHKKKQNSILLDIEESYKSGNLLKTRQLITSLDKKERNNPELLQLEQALNYSISETIQDHFSDANKFYTDGNFQQAITLWEQVLQYEPDNAIAKKNIIRAEKVIDKLSTLREKQQN